MSRRSGSEAPKGGHSFRPSMGDKHCSNEGKLMEKNPHAPPATKGLGGDKGSTINGLGSRNTEDETNGSIPGNQKPGNIHEKQKDSGIRLNTGSIFPFQGKENLIKPTTQKESGEDMMWEIETQQREEP